MSIYICRGHEFSQSPETKVNDNVKPEAPLNDAVKCSPQDGAPSRLTSGQEQFVQSLQVNKMQWRAPCHV